MKNQPLLAVIAAVAVLALGCGAAESSPGPVAAAAPVEPAPTEPPPVLDHGLVSTTYPAFSPAMGQLVNNGGAVLTNPVIITVTWAGEGRAADLEALGDALGPSPYWRETTSEYGVLAAVSGEENHVRLPAAAPDTMSDKELDAFVASNVTTGTFPTPATGQPVYILYLPQTTKLLLSGKSACAQGVGGYHDSTKVDLKAVAYAIVPRCGSSFDNVTVAASHELVEAATDPYPHSRPAWTGFREEDLAWEFFQQFSSENGDACEFYRDSDLLAGIESGLAVTVQRSWSNKSATAGHDPCLPAFRNTTFFNTTPLGLEDVHVDLADLGGGAATAKGFNVGVGATRTIALGLYSDGPTGAWTLSATAGGTAGGSEGDMDLVLDVTRGQNGQKAYLTVKVNTAPTGSQIITIESTRGGTTHFMPILIASR